MKKFLLTAGFAVALTGTAFAGGGYHDPCTGCGYDVPDEPDCEMCEEKSNQLEIDLCATVNVPLNLDGVDCKISFPCLYRGGYDGNPDGIYDNYQGPGNGGDYYLDPGSNAVRNSGRLAVVRLWGDENDDVNFFIGDLDGAPAGHVRLFHVAHPGQNSDGSGNPTAFDVELKVFADHVDIGGYPNVNPPTVGGGGSGYDDFLSPANQAGPFRLGNGPYDSGPPPGTEADEIGVGAMNLWIGGTAALQPGQQRGEYEGDFDIWADYVP